MSKAKKIIPPVLFFIKKNLVVIIAGVAAVISAFFVPPDKKYLDYIDLKTLTCLFCSLAAVSALSAIHFFSIIAKKIVVFFKNTRACIIALVYITFIGSMFLANDMALITFLPLGYFVLISTGEEKLMSFTFIMQNIAANLGGMLTPFGNPQSLFLFTKFSIPTTEFFSIMFPSFLLSIILITGCCIFFIKKKPMILIYNDSLTLNKKKARLYIAMFVFSIIIVFNIIPYYYGFVIIPLILLLSDRKVLFRIDYALLSTFALFFVFSGNVSRIPVIKEIISSFLEKSTLITSVISCQIISNVPSAILLSEFTTNYKELLMGVNIGGTGTLIASLASLITFREFIKHNPNSAGKYLKEFTIYNFVFLSLLLALCLLLK